MIEIFKDIPGYEGRYAVSNKGRVLTRKKFPGNVMMPEIMKLGYLRVDLTDKKYLIHRLVSMCFMPSGNGKEINHKDGNKANNHVENLEWVTKSENVNHSYRVIGRKKPIHKYRIPAAYDPHSGAILMAFYSMKFASKFLATTAGNVTAACQGQFKLRGYYWKYLKND